MLKRYIGDRAFYRRVFGIAIPIMIQNGITNFVSMLDNIMVGQIGTAPMSGASIVNGLLFVFNLCIFGASSGAGIFTAQFYGSQDHKGIRHTFRFKFLICTFLSLVGWAIFRMGGETLVRLYLTGEGDAADAAQVLAYGMQYLRWMLWGLIPFALANVYSSTLRETGQTMVPMAAGIAAVLINLFLNYVLIFGHFGAPEMGVEGAALATVISRYAELAIVAVWTHTHSRKNPFIRGAYRSFRIPVALLRDIFLKGMPLLVNELLWASGIAVLNQCYSTCGLTVVPAMNISSTLFNLSSVVFMAMGVSVGIIMGQMLGSGCREEEVRDANRKLIAVSVTSGVVFGLLMASVSGSFPAIYNTTQEVRLLATRLILLCALVMPFEAYTNATYFTLRSGGQVLVTLLFDSCYTWVGNVSVVFLLSRLTSITILPLYAVCQLANCCKSFLGAYMLKQGKWIRNLTQ